jgi:hypothetical protein
MLTIGIPIKVPSICRACGKHRRTGADSNIADMDQLVEQLGLAMSSSVEHRVWLMPRLHCEAGIVSRVQIGGGGAGNGIV